MDQLLSTLALGRFGRTMTLVLDERDPSARDWSSWSVAYAEGARDHGVRRLLVVTRGGAPNSAQRREVIERVVRDVGRTAADQFRTGICGNTPAARTVTAAIAWWYGVPNMKLFGYDQQLDALRFIDADEVQHEDIVAAVRRLDQGLRRRA